MSDSAEPLEWVAKAEEDWAAAHAVLRRKTPLPAIACFHAQQCAEKYLKAILIARRHRFSHVHDLLILNQECHATGILLGISEDALPHFRTMPSKRATLAMPPQLKTRAKRSKRRVPFASLRENF